MELWLNKDGSTRGAMNIQLTGQYNLNSRWTYRQIPPFRMEEHACC